MRQRQDPRKDADDTTWFRAVSGAMAVGFLSIVLYSWTQKSWSRVLACALLIGLAAALVGALLGFVFGVPKTVARAAKAPGDGATPYEGNTNLEEISDWLTKILVGAGLVELKSVPGALDTFGAKFVSNGSLGSFGWVAGPSVAISYSVCGFLLAYLWARIYMINDLNPAEVIQVAAAAKNAVIDVDIAENAADKALAVAEGAQLDFGEAVSAADALPKTGASVPSTAATGNDSGASDALVDSAKTVTEALSIASNSTRKTEVLAGNLAEGLGGTAAATPAPQEVPPQEVSPEPQEVQPKEVPPEQ